MTENEAGQVSLFDRGSWSGKTCLGRSAQTRGETFGKCSEKLSKSQNRVPPMCLCLKKGNGQSQDAYTMKWADGGWSIAWRLHDAQFWGVPQRRKRIAVVADFGGLTASEILFERKSVSRDTDTGGEAREEITSDSGRGVDKTIIVDDQGGSVINVTSDVVPTIRTQTHGHLPLVYDARGNGSGDISPTLTGDHQNCITDYTAICVGNGQLNQISMAEQANTLDTMHDQQAVMVLRFDTTQITSPQNRSHPHYGDPCHPLAAQAHAPSIVTAVDCRNLNEHQEVSGTLQCKQTGGYSLNYQNPVRTPSGVRRLTPLECERLQGYPDGWTDIGEWVDRKGRKRKTSDTARYKALGNSIALPFWLWLLRRISSQYERPATLGSLFDGIGGFPLCWERINGPGTAIWASEIEEFPMAVTRVRFGRGGET